VKRVLMVAYHFPPLAGSSGIQRTLRFVQHLPALGWQPLVLGASPRAFERSSDDLLADIPVGTVVRRAFALDTARHLQIGGRYLASMARPDRWISWKFAAVRAGLQMVREFRPDAIWSTYPIATAHVIAAALHRKTGIPWIADFRDPMAQDGYPADPKTRQNFLEIESEAAARARYCVFTTPGAARDYQHRYPAAARRMVVIENGYDEESFASIPTASAVHPQASGRQVLLLHSGIVYPSDRDPTHLFEALGKLKAAGILTPGNLRIRFRASSHDDFLRNLAQLHDALEFIELCPPLAYREALAEMLTADALLVMQASNCNDQIPAKVYEYLRAGRPIFALTDPAGDTADVLRKAGLTALARLDSTSDIEKSLPPLVHNWSYGIGQVPGRLAVAEASRRNRSALLATLLGEVSGAIATPKCRANS
jgi:glycosyltransferase involved in cell wall biosynthesis